MSETVLIGDKALMRKLARMVTGTEALLGLAAEMGAAVFKSAAESRAPGPHIETEEVVRTRTLATRAIGPDKAHWYYGLLETGARAHMIEGAPLVFEGSRGVVFVRAVKHPGFGARPFLRPAFDADRDEATRRVGEALKRAIEA